MADIETTIRRFIVKEIMYEKNEPLLGFDQPLFETGILDSAGLIHLVLLLDKEFNFSVPQDDLIPEHFETIRAISNYLKKRLVVR
jgi:acyl carrier protein